MQFKRCLSASLFALALPFSLHSLLPVNSHSFPVRSPAPPTPLASTLQRAKGLFENNDPAKGGSEYLRQKISIAERIVLEVCVYSSVDACV